MNPANTPDESSAEDDGLIDITREANSLPPLPKPPPSRQEAMHVVAKLLRPGAYVLRSPNGLATLFPGLKRHKPKRKK